MTFNLAQEDKGLIKNKVVPCEKEVHLEFEDQPEMMLARIKPQSIVSCFHQLPGDSKS